MRELKFEKGKQKKYQRGVCAQGRREVTTCTNWEKEVKGSPAT